MIPPLPHRIMRERIAVEFFDCAEPLSARKRIEELCTGPLSDALDAALSAWDLAPDEVVSLGRLELNVTGLTEQNLETELIPKIVLALNRALQHQLGAPRLTQTPATARPVSGSLLEELCFFLQRGFLPWPVSNPRQWQLQAAQVLATVPLHELAHVFSLLLSASPRLRFVRHFPAVLRGRILPQLWQTPDLEPLLEDTEILLLSTLAPTTTDLRLRDDLLAILLAHGILRRGEGQAGLEAAARVILDRVLQERPFPLLSRLVWRSHSFARVANNWIGPSGIPEEPSEAPLSEARSLPAAGAESQALHHGRVSGDEPIFINNAGLVIVAPYLPTLFAKLGFEEKGRIVRPGEALALTHYLVFGVTERSEWDLVLGKILCGIPLEQAVQVSCELLPEHMAEANALLRGVIANWPTLKNTSIDGLRETFLQREGILARKTIGWNLRVERKAPDVLLDTLPWTISMIRLPWMECMLTTAWGGE